MPSLPPRTAPTTLLLLVPVQPCILYCDGAYTVSAAAVHRNPSRLLAPTPAEERMRPTRLTQTTATRSRLGESTDGEPGEPRANHNFLMPSSYVNSADAWGSYRRHMQYGPTAELSSSSSHGNTVSTAPRRFWGRKGSETIRETANHAKSRARSALCSKRRLTRTWRAHERSYCPPTSAVQVQAQSAGQHRRARADAAMLRLLRHDSADVAGVAASV